MLTLTAEFIILMVLLATRIPPRVYAPIFSFLTLILLFYLDEEFLSLQFKQLSRLGLPGKVLNAMLALSSVACLCWFVYTTNVLPSRAKQERNALLKQAIIDMKPDSKMLYYAWATCFPYELIGPYDDLRDYFNSLNLLPLGVQGQNPLVTRRLAEFGIEKKDACKSLCNNSRITLISEPILFNEHLEQYFKEHYNEKPKFVETFHSPVLNTYQLKAE
jgi:hypothetical protein